MLTNQELRELSQINPMKSTIALAADWIGIILVFAMLMFFPHPLTFIFGFIFIGKLQLNLAIMMHDAAHKRLFQSGLWNDRLSQIFTAAPLFFSMNSYRTLHLKHHKDPLAPDDPDLSLIGGYPIPASSLVRKLLRDLFGVSYFKFIRYFIYMARKPKISSATLDRPRSESTGKVGSSKLLVFSSIFFVNLVLFTALFALHHGWLYFFFWVLPMMTILQVLLRIRGIAEHGGYRQNADQSTNARTVINPVQTFLFAPHNVGYHIEHHLYPSVPFYNLPQVHQLLKPRGVLPSSNVYKGYGSILKELIQDRSS